VGDVIHDGAFTSTSVSPATAANVTHSGDGCAIARNDSPALLVTYSPADRRLDGLFIASTDNDDEHSAGEEGEVLLYPGSGFVVRDIREAVIGSLPAKILLVEYCGHGEKSQVCSAVKNQPVPATHAREYERIVKGALRERK
jgi:hypothetical protein